MAAVIEPDAGQLGKSGLCRLLGWSRPKLDLRLEADSQFPVLQRGMKGGGWRFDAPAVLAYLRGDDQPSDRQEGPFDPSGDNPAPSLERGATVVHMGEHSARQRRDAVQAEILVDKLRRDRGDLVEAHEMRRVLEQLQAGINRGLDRLCDQLLAIPQISGADDVVHELMNELRDLMAAELRQLTEPRSTRSTNPRPAVGQNTGSRR